MEAVRQFDARGFARIAFLIGAAILILCCAFLSANQAKAASQSRYRVQTLRHITSEDGKKYLEQASIDCDASAIPDTNTLLLTALPGELIKATALLKLVDSEQRYVIKQLCPVSEADKLPTNEQIAGEIADSAIGTFENPPEQKVSTKAIIDKHKDMVMVIAPAETLEKILSAITQLQLSAEPELPAEPEIAEPELPVEPGEIEKQPTEPPAEIGELEVIEETLLEDEPDANDVADEPDTNDVAVEELFDSLLSSLAEPEPEPVEPNVVIVEAEAVAAEAEEVEEVKEEAEEAVAEVVAEAEEAKPAAEPEKKPRSYQPQYSSLADEELELNLPEKLKIVDLLDLVGKYLQLDYLFDPDEINGEVTLRVQGPIRIKELYPLLESVLKSKGFVMSRKNNFVTIVPKAKVMDIDPELLHDDKGMVKYGDVIITRVFKLDHVDTASAENLLAGMKLGENVRAIEETKTLIVTDYAFRMKRIEELLTMIDEPGKPKKFRFRTLKYTMAANLAPQVKALAEELGAISIAIAAPDATPEPAASTRTRTRVPTKQPVTAPTPAAGKPTVYLDADERTNRIMMIGLDEQLDIVDELIDTLDVEKRDLRAMRLYEIQHVGAEEIVEKLAELGIISTKTTTQQTAGRTRPTTATSAGEASAATTTTPEPMAEEPQVVIIGATNSLLVNATNQQHIQIATIIGFVDTEPEKSAIPYVVYELENQKPEELKVVLDALIQETITQTADKDAKIQKTTTTKKIEENIIIVDDSKSNSLIVYANKRNQQWISSLIEQLDEYRPQVLLDVTLVEITKNDAFKFDLDLVSKFPMLAGPGMDKLAPLFGTLASDPNVVAIPDRTIIEAASRAGDGGTGFYADRHIQALLEMMDTKGYGRVLARPKLLVNDNEEGSIKSEEVQYVVREETKVLPGTTTGTSTTATSVTFEKYDAGIELAIEPHISKGDQLRLKIALVRTDFRPTPDTIIQDGTSTRTVPTPPDTVTSNVETVITVPDNFTIILGGLETIKQNKSGTKVPILGDLPLIGGLFKNTDNADAQSRLYIFVKAHILRPGEKLTGESDIEIVSRKNRHAFEEMEDKFQKLENWPGSEPEPMDPVRILEED